jgi:hypothetical protein
MLIFFIVLAIILIVGSAMILLRTANMPKIPKNIKPQPYEDDD